MSQPKTWVQGPSKAAGRAWVAMGLLSLSAGLMVGASPAHAQLFPDNEARRAIVELREKGDLDRKALTEVNIRLAEQLQQLQRAMLELNNQVEQIRADLAKQRGANEQLARELSELQRKQKDVQQAALAAEERVKKLEPLRVTMDGREFAADPEEKRQYEDALSLLRQGDYAAASTALSAFQRRWPNSGYTDAARFWHGNALYGKREHKESLAVFKTFLAGAPDHPRAAEAMLAAANAQLETKDTKAAKAMLQDLVKAYPKSEAAQAAKDRLAVLK